MEIVKGMTAPSHMAVQPDGSIFAIEQWSGKVHLFIPGKNDGQRHAGPYALESPEGIAGLGLLYMNFLRK